MFSNKLKKLNQALHNNQIQPEDRIKVISALLLFYKTNNAVQTESLVQEINSNTLRVLTHHNKESYFNKIKLALPTDKEAALKYQQAIVHCMGILSTMKSDAVSKTEEDNLGLFYEQFIKHARGSKEGIVLTPFHITRLAVKALDVSPNNRIYDPTCGSGRFLTTAIQHVKEKYPLNYSDFLDGNVYGVEQLADLYLFALVNMVYQGVTRTEIHNGNCLDYQFTETPFDRVFMNPPFKSRTTEVQIVDHALSQMKTGGLLFAVLPAVVIGKNKYLTWRQHFLSKHTLKSVVKFNTALFHPVSEATYGFIAVAKQPHNPASKVLFCELFDDLQKHPSKQTSRYDIQDNQEQVTTQLSNFLNKQMVSEHNRTIKLSSIDYDHIISFYPEHYLATSKPNSHYNTIGRKSDLMKAKHINSNQPPEPVKTKKTQKIKETMMLYNAKEFFTSEIKPPIKSLKGYQDGTIPVVSATAYNNGISKYLDIPIQDCMSNCVTISKTHNTKPCEAFWHPYLFSAINTVIILKPINELIQNEDALLYLCESIKECNSWRYHYARPVEIDELKIYLPALSNKQPDFEAMGNIVKHQTA